MSEGRVLAILLSGLLIMLSTPVLAAPADLDNTFGGGTGKVVTPIDGSVDTPFGLAIQNDGKILAAGTCQGASSNTAICIARYQPDGSLDLSFGITGRAITPMSPGYDRGRRVAVQPDGKILLSGTCFVSPSSYAFCLARYNANGSLDNTFGNSGTTISPTGQAGGFDHENWSLAMQPDGKIVAGGSCRDGNETDFCAARYNINGSLDANFGIGGRAITSLTPDVDTAFDLAIQADGKIIMGGTCSSRMCLVRYNANGSLDLNFQGTGKVIAFMDLPPQRSGHGIALQPDGKIILGGRCFAGGLNLFCVARFNSDGSLDTSFNGTGSVVTVTESSVAETYRTALQPDGKILLAGTCTLDGDFFTYRFCVIRYNPDGSVDNSFNNGTQLLTMIGTANSTATVIALQPDGKIILAGPCSSGQQHVTCLARYEGGPFGYQNCKPDLDGDGAFLATTDALINMRVALGITGDAVINGITFPPTATRNTWPLIRDYLVSQCGMSLVQ